MLAEIFLLRLQNLLRTDAPVKSSARELRFVPVSQPRK